MPSVDPQLSAIATDLDELVRRIGALAHDLDQEPTEQAAAELYETERALRTASRRLGSARRRLG